MGPIQDHIIFWTFLIFLFLFFWARYRKIRLATLYQLRPITYDTHIMLTNCDSEFLYFGHMYDEDYLTGLNSYLQTNYLTIEATTTREIFGTNPVPGERRTQHPEYDWHTIQNDRWSSRKKKKYYRTVCIHFLPNQ